MVSNHLRHLIQLDELRDIVVHSPIDRAAISALSVLLLLARDGDFKATITLMRALAEELGHDPNSAELTASQSLQELLAAPNVAPLLRVYACAIQPRNLLANIDIVSKLSVEPSSLEEFNGLKRLVWRNAVLQHEALKAHLLCTFAGKLDMMMDGFLPHSVPLKGLLTVLSECLVVPGGDADSNLRFGRDLILRNPDAKRIIGRFWHEQGHIFFDAILASSIGPDPSSPAVVHQCFLPEIATSLPKLMENAWQLRGKPIQSGDPRGRKLGLGTIILCRHERRELGSFFLWSLWQLSGPLDLRIGALYALYTLTVLGIDLSRVAIAYTQNGTLHFGFVGEDPKLDSLIQRIEGLDLNQLATTCPGESQLWIDELRYMGRVGRFNEDVAIALGVSKGPRFYPWSERIIEDIKYVRELRSVGSPQVMSDEDASAALAATWRSAGADVFRNVLLTRAAPQDFLRSSALPISEIGISLFAIRTSEGVDCYGPTLADIQQILHIFHEFGGDLNSPVAPSGSTLLIGAVGKGIELVRFLLACGADVNCPGANGETPLIACASIGAADIAKELIAANASVQARTDAGDTALHRAVATESIEVAQVLLANGADADWKNNTGQTPLMQAKSERAVELLCQFGATVDEPTPEGETALMTAAQSGLTAVVRALLVRGADPTAANKLGKTALHHAASAGHGSAGTECMEALLDAGADVHEETNEGVTPLMIAAAKGHTAMVKTLIAAGADIDASQKDGNTPLLLAIQGGHVDAVRQLLEAGASVTNANVAGETALGLVEGEVSEDMQKLVYAARKTEGPAEGYA